MRNLNLFVLFDVYKHLFFFFLFSSRVLPLTPFFSLSPIPLFFSYSLSFFLFYPILFFLPFLWFSLYFFLVCLTFNVNCVFLLLVQCRFNIKMLFIRFRWWTKYFKTFRAVIHFNCVEPNVLFTKCSSLFRFGIMLAISRQAIIITTQQYVIIIISVLNTQYVSQN